MPVTVSATIAGLQLLSMRVGAATKLITADAAHLIQAESMKAAPVGMAGDSTNAPGDLRRSIDVEGPVKVPGGFFARVGPTTVYGRQRELGGDIYPRTARLLETVFSAHVHQKPNPYMLRGEMAAIPKIEAVANARLAAAIGGA